MSESSPPNPNYVDTKPVWACEELRFATPGDGQKYIETGDITLSVPSHEFVRAIDERRSIIRPNPAYEAAPYSMEIIFFDERRGAGILRKSP